MRTRWRWPISVTRTRQLGGFALMLLAITQSVRGELEFDRAVAVSALTPIMTVAWFLPYGPYARRDAFGVWLLGGASTLLMLLLPGIGPSVTTYADDESVFAALDAGARGYLTKDASASEIQKAIRTVFDGEALLDPSVQRRLLEHTLRAPVTPPALPSSPSYPDGLTQREAEVLREIAAGHSNREIADHLSISQATVKTHVNNIFSKAGLRDRAQAVVYAIRRGLAS